MSDQHTFQPRSEFVRTEATPQSYTLVALNGADILRCHNISRPALSALREAFGNEVRFFGEIGDGDVAEFVFRSNPWSTKTVRSETLIVHLFTVLLAHQYTFLTPTDYGRQYLDKLSLTFTRPTSISSNPLATDSVFALSFVAPTVLRVINAPLHATPAILQSVRGTWPRGVKSERKLGNGSWEFRLKGFGYFSTEKSDEAILPHVFALLRSFDSHALKLVAAVPIGGRSRSKDLWIFTAPGTSKSPSNQGGSPYQATLESGTAHSPGLFTASPTVGTSHAKFATDEPDRSLPIAAAHVRSASAPGPHRKPPVTMPSANPPTPPRAKPSTPPRAKPSTPPSAKPPTPITLPPASSSPPKPVPVPVPAPISIPPKRNSSLLRKIRAGGGTGRTPSGRFRHPPPPPVLPSANGHGVANGGGASGPVRSGSLASGEIIYETPLPGQARVPASPVSPTSPGFVMPPPILQTSPVQQSHAVPAEPSPVPANDTTEDLLPGGAFRDSAFSSSTDASHDVDILWTGGAPAVKSPGEHLADVHEGEEVDQVAARSPDVVRTVHEEVRPKSERAELAHTEGAEKDKPARLKRPSMSSKASTPNEWVFVSVDRPQAGKESSAPSLPPRTETEAGSPPAPVVDSLPPPPPPVPESTHKGSLRKWFGSNPPDKSKTKATSIPKRHRGGLVPAIRSSRRLTID